MSALHNLHQYKGHRPNLSVLTTMSANDSDYGHAPTKGLNTKQSLVEQVLLAPTKRDQAKLLIKAAKNPHFTPQFRKFRWQRLNWEGANLKNMKGLDQLPLNLIPLNGADLSDNKLQIESLRNAQWQGVNLTNTTVITQNAAGLNLNYATGNGAVLIGNFSGAQMTGDRLTNMTMAANVTNAALNGFIPTGESDTLRTIATSMRSDAKNDSSWIVPEAPKLKGKKEPTTAANDEKFEMVPQRPCGNMNILAHLPLALGVKP